MANHHASCLALVTLFVLSVCSSHAQTDSKNSEIEYNGSRGASVSIHLHAPVPEAALPFPRFSSLDVRDARPDSIALGFIRKGLLNRTRKIVFATSGTQEIGNYAKKLFPIEQGAQKNTSLLIVIKRLWLSDEVNADGVSLSSPSGYKVSAVTAKFEFFLRKDSFYYPLYRFDSTLTLPQPLSTCMKTHLEKIVSLSLKQLQGLETDKILNTIKPLAAADIENFNFQRFENPVFHSNIFRIGIFQKDADFLAPRHGIR